MTSNPVRCYGKTASKKTYIKKHSTQSMEVVNDLLAKNITKRLMTTDNKRPTRRNLGIEIKEPPPLRKEPYLSDNSSLDVDDTFDKLCKGGIQNNLAMCNNYGSFQKVCSTSESDVSQQTKSKLNLIDNTVYSPIMTRTRKRKIPNIVITNYEDSDDKSKKIAVEPTSRDKSLEMSSLSIERERPNNPRFKSLSYIKINNKEADTSHTSRMEASYEPIFTKTFRARQAMSSVHSSTPIAVPKSKTAHLLSIKDPLSPISLQSNRFLKESYNEIHRWDTKFLAASESSNDKTPSVNNNSICMYDDDKLRCNPKVYLKSLEDFRGFTDKEQILSHSKSEKISRNFINFSSICISNNDLVEDSDIEMLSTNVNSIDTDKLTKTKSKTKLSSDHRKKSYKEISSEISAALNQTASSRMPSIDNNNVSNSSEVAKYLPCDDIKLRISAKVYLKATDDFRRYNITAESLKNVSLCLNSINSSNSFNRSSGPSYHPVTCKTEQKSEISDSEIIVIDDDTILSSRDVSVETQQNVDNSIVDEDSIKCATEIESNDVFVVPVARPAKKRLTSGVPLKPGKSYRRSLSLYKRNSVALDVRKGSDAGGYVAEQDETDAIKLDFSLRKLSLNPLANTSILPFPLSARDIVLRRCGQTEPLRFEQCYTDSVLQHCRKIGEGVYGEVFLYRNQHGGTTVMKVIPIEGDQVVNGEQQKKYEEILSEIIIAMELSNLRNKRKNSTSGFSKVDQIRCVQGCYPIQLLELWDLFAENHISENDSPEMFTDNQLYIVLELANGGDDLESYMFTNASQALSMFKQTAYALAVAESELNFEHRDLHWGNVLISTVKRNAKVQFHLNGKEINIPTNGIEIAIIDFTLSRIEYKDVVIFNDLGNDEDLFNATGDYQFDIYKLMQKRNENDWRRYEPYTNILWLHYIVDKAISALHYNNTQTKQHKDNLKKLETIKSGILSFNSVTDFVTNFFNSFQ